MELTSVEKINQIRTALNAAFLERSDEIEIILTSIIANQNCQFIGAPGTGKSALALAVSQCLNMSLFKVNLDQDLDPDFVIGHISLSEMRDNDRIVRNTSGKIADAELVFLDEVNKCNSAMKNALLLPLNERMIDVGDGQPRSTKIRSVIGASNEFPGCDSIDDDTYHLIHDPNWDRWTLRKLVQYITGDTSFRQLLTQKDIGQVQLDPSFVLGLDEVDLLRDACKQVNCDSVIGSIMKIRAHLEVAGISLSDRRWLALLKSIRARAVMDGRNDANSSDLAILKHGLWRRPEEMEIVSETLAEHIVDPTAVIQKAINLWRNDLKEALAITEQKDIGIVVTKNSAIKKQIDNLDLSSATSQQKSEIKDITSRLRSHIANIMNFDGGSNA